MRAVLTTGENQQKPEKTVTIAKNLKDNTGIKVLHNIDLLWERGLHNNSELTVVRYADAYDF